MSDIDKVRSELELTRAELASTVDALQAKLDVRALARRRAEDAEHRAAEAYAQVKAATPPPVQHALDRVEGVAAPAVGKAMAEPKRTLLIAGSVLAALLVLRRLRH